MLDNLNSALSHISDEQLDALFSETPASTATADGLVIGKSTPDTELPQLELEELDALETPVEEKKEEAEEKKDAEVVIPDAKKEEGKVEDKPEDVAAHKEILKANVDYLVSKGYFKDFDGRDEIEWTDELYAELLEAQIKAAVEDKYDSKKKSAGSVGEAIIDFVEKGGDPDLVIDLFKEQKALQQFDISSEDSQKELVTKYYKDLGWKSEKIKKYIDSVSLEDGALEGEAKEIKDKYEEGYKQQLAGLRQQQAQIEQEQTRRRETFEKNVSKVIDDNKSYDDARRNTIKNGLFKYKKLDDGSLVNELYVRFAEWQSDPTKYVELAEFILDHDNYIKRKEIEAQNKAVDKSFKFIKGNAAVSKKAGSTHVESDKSDNQNSFSFAFKK